MPPTAKTAQPLFLVAEKWINEEKSGRGGEIRTHDLLYPKQARYQATLRPADQGRKNCPVSARIANDFQGNFPHVFEASIKRPDALRTLISGKKTLNRPKGRLFGTPNVRLMYA